ncbi:hypothetical protein Pth03_76000 [Planotetraspora thailandica]|uniref:Uncharacterized protein n=1 Tax=Planotetraspora thailandica TaxID=487172 RepID=A0A8J3Y1U3_9ACTN|nr:hypothetical protein Pth03_76000 [Planotetraspora thailandica]
MAAAPAGPAPVLITGGAAYAPTTRLTGLRPEWREMDRLRGQDPRRTSARESTDTTDVGNAVQDRVRPK